MAEFRYNGGRGFYVVAGTSGNILWGEEYVDSFERRAVQDRVAARLLPGSFYAEGKTREEAEWRAREQIVKVRGSGERVGP